MRFVALVLAVAMIGGLGLVTVGTAQAHGGDGGGAIDLLQSYASCPVVNSVQAAALGNTCTEMLEGHNQ